MIKTFIFISLMLNVVLIEHKSYTSNSTEKVQATSEKEDIKADTKPLAKDKEYSPNKVPESSLVSNERWSKIQVAVQANAETLNNPMQSYLSGVVALVHTVEDLKQYLNSDAPRSHKSQLINQLGLSRNQKGFDLLTDLFQSRESHPEFIREIIQSLSHYKGEPIKAMLSDFFRNDWSNEEETIIAAYHLAAIYEDKEAKDFLVKEAKEEKSRARYYLKRLDQIRP